MCCCGGEEAGQDLLAMSRDDSFGTSYEVLLQNFFSDAFPPPRVKCLNLDTRGRGGDSFIVALGPPLSWSGCGGVGGLSSMPFTKLCSMGWWGHMRVILLLLPSFGKLLSTYSG